MTDYGGAGAHRVLLRQALGGDEFLRVTWHERKGVFVFSHWTGDTCTSAIPVRVSELGDLASMTVGALAQRAASVTEPASSADPAETWAAASAWSAPDPAGVCDPGLVRPA